MDERNINNFQSQFLAKTTTSAGQQVQSVKMWNIEKRYILLFYERFVSEEFFAFLLDGHSRSCLTFHECLGPGDGIGRIGRKCSDDRNSLLEDID